MNPTPLLRLAPPTAAAPAAPAEGRALATRRAAAAPARRPALGTPARLLAPRPGGPAPGAPSLARTGAPVAPVERRRAAPADPLGLAGLDACVAEAVGVARRRDDGPRDPASFAALAGRLERAGAGLPPPYRRAVVAPLLATLRGLGPEAFHRLLAGDPARQRGAGLLLDLSQAVLQRGEGHAGRATRAFQEVVSDLYAGFRAGAGRRGAPWPEGAALPPVVRWGKAEAGPYTWPGAETGKLDVAAAVVSLPAANAAGGLLAWAMLGHETAGHAALAAHPGLARQLGRAAERAVAGSGLPPRVGRYLAERIDEVAADVVGVLTMGPASAVGLVGYVRALNAAWGGAARLGSTGFAASAHPAALLRAYLAAETVRLLPLAGAARWADRLLAEAGEDLGPIRLAGLPVTPAAARTIAAAVARALVTARLPALGGRSLGELRAWGDRDQALVASLRRALAAPATAAPSLTGHTAGHAVAAAVELAVSGEAAPGAALERLLSLLDEMHRRNPRWRGAAADAIRSGTSPPRSP